jgi:hypothetical protein
VHHAEVTPFCRAETGLFEQLTIGGGKNVFAGINLAGRQLKERTAERITILAHEEELAIIEFGDDGHRPLVSHVFPQALLTIRQQNPVTAQIQQPAAEDLRALEGLFVEMWIFVFHFFRKCQRSFDPALPMPMSGIEIPVFISMAMKTPRQAGRSGQ